MSVLGKRSTCPVGRDATRRRKETEILSDLVNMLPLPSVEVDRVTQMKGLKLAIQYFRLHQMLPTKGDRHVKNSVRHLWLNDIFQHEAKIILVVDSSGTIIYVSEQAVNVLGLFQVDVIGANYCEVVHSEDQEDFKKLLDGDAVHCHLIRMKDTLSPNAKHKGNFQCRVMHISVLGHCEKKDLSVTVLACEPFDKVPILEIVISASSEFTVNPHTNTIIDVDWKFELFSGYSRKDVIGSDPRVYVFPNDIEFTEEKHKMMLEKVLTPGGFCQPPYRTMTGYGQWFWMRMTMKPNKIRNGKLVELKGRMTVLSQYNPEEYASGRATPQLTAVPTQDRSDSLSTDPLSLSSVDYNSLPTLSDLPTLSPQSVGSSSVHSSGHIPSSTEHLSDLSVEDILGEEDTSLHNHLSLLGLYASNASGSSEHTLPHSQENEIYSNSEHITCNQPLPKNPKANTEDLHSFLDLFLH